MAKTTVHLTNNEMQNLIEFVQTCSVSDFWINEYSTGIGNKLVVTNSAGKEQDITDYESW